MRGDSVSGDIGLLSAEGEWIIPQSALRSPHFLPLRFLSSLIVYHSTQPNLKMPKLLLSNS